LSLTPKIKSVEIFEIPVPNLTVIETDDVSWTNTNRLAWWNCWQPPKTPDLIWPCDGLTYLIERKPYPTFANPYAITGQYLAGLEYARYSLDALARQQRNAYTSLVADYLERLQQNESDDQETPPWLELSSLLENPISPYELVAAGIPCFDEVLCKILQLRSQFLRTASILRRVTRHLSPIRKLFHSKYLRSFCGLDWSKRAWSLLHGSHPPKTCLIAAVLGCA